MIDFSYASRATPRDFDIYSPDATFEDPLMHAQGYALTATQAICLYKTIGQLPVSMF